MKKIWFRVGMEVEISDDEIDEIIEIIVTFIYLLVDIIISMLSTYLCMWVRRVAWSILWALGA